MPLNFRMFPTGSIYRRIIGGHHNKCVHFTESGDIVIIIDFFEEKGTTRVPKQKPRGEDGQHMYTIHGTHYMDMDILSLFTPPSLILFPRIVFDMPTGATHEAH